MEPAEARQRLSDFLGQFDQVAVAFSAGVDSAVVAKAAQLALGDRAQAVTAVSPSLAQGELERAQATAAQIGIRHIVVETKELLDENYAANPANRCYFCKSELYDQMATVAATSNGVTLLNGANLDDAGDYRPGMQAAQERQVRSPLLECGINKSVVRQLAQAWQLEVWDKPAAPCLASRLAYGVAVTSERMEMVDLAERWLREQGFEICRVRLHDGDLARVEIPREQIPNLLATDLFSELDHELRRIGFRYVTVDLAGFQSGSLNRLLRIQEPESA